MPRKAREKSSTGIYAVLLESEYEIFRDDDDYNEFIVRADEYLGANAVAFALIENAICLIVKESEKGIGMDIKPLTTSYARYYGTRYDLDGGLFKQRFKSEPIETADAMAWNLATVHKLCETLSKDGYTGKYDGDELIVSESAMSLMGDRTKYDELMGEEKVLTSFFATLSADKSVLGENMPTPKTVKKSAPKKVKQTPSKTAEVKVEEKIEEKIEEKAEEKPIPKKKKMPTWLL